MLLSRSIAFHQLRLQLGPYLVSPIDAHANEPGTTGRHPSDARDADLLRGAMSDDRFLAHVQEYGPAHTDAALFAAAMASPGLE